MGATYCSKSVNKYIKQEKTSTNWMQNVNVYNFNSSENMITISIY